MGCREILLSPIMYTIQTHEMVGLSRVVKFPKEKDLCILNKNSGDAALNLVLSGSFC